MSVTSRAAITIIAKPNCENEKADTQAMFSTPLTSHHGPMRRTASLDPSPGSA